MKKEGNILFCGVGGQGIVLACEVTALGLLQAGFDLKTSEVHGMAQRGGSVVAHLRFGKKVYSPLIDPGRADIVVAFEMMEAVRYLPFMHRDSKVIVNTHMILPPAVATGRASYPENVLDELKNRRLDLVALDAFSISKAVGEIRTANITMVGVLSGFLPVGKEVFAEVIAGRVPERFREVNLRAFAEGRKLSKR